MNKARIIPLSAAEMVNYSSVPLLSKSQCTTDAKGNTVFFHLPNYPRAQVMEDAKNNKRGGDMVDPAVSRQVVLAAQYPSLGSGYNK